MTDITTKTVEIDKAPGRSRRSAATARKGSSAMPRVLSLIILVAFLLLWEVAADRWVPSLFISRPSDVAATLIDWTRDGTLWRNASATFSVAVVGFLLGGVAALAAGYVLGVSKLWAAVFEPFITALYSLPKVAIIPLLIIWVGIGPKLGVAVSGLIVFLLLFYNTYYGIREVSPKLLDAMRVMGGSRWDLAVRVRAPSALVWVVVGLRISMPQALVGVVTAEILAGSRGLGYLVSYNAAQFNTAGTIGAITVLLIIGVFLDYAIRIFSRRALAWNETS
ncbi:ABC transporter permease [Janibacter hoylei]|uniref:ABC transporter permease n=1 Tax=Janibacter hoylei TaxID=364298 RepID=UPI002491A48D|nr:ABC transporter permease [Janibacter hoylei]